MADKFVNKIKFFMGLDDDSDEVENDIENEEITKIENESLKTEDAQNLFLNKKFYDEPKVNSMDRDSSKFNVTIIKPEDFNESANVVNNLKNRKPVIINLESLDIEIARKVFDFCSGALYALNGKIFKVSKNIFLLAPENVDISGNLKNTVPTDYEME
ncbi:MAG: cell division protein SepF [Clostridiales bacterium]|nr:cell division protein SepF [Clostridiales bacterium]